MPIVRSIDTVTKEVTEREMDPSEISAWSPDPTLSLARQLRETSLNRLAGIAGRASRAGDTALAESCDTAAQSLLDLINADDVVAAKSEAELRAAIKTNYLQIVVIAGEELASAFSAFDL